MASVRGAYYPSRPSSVVARACGATRSAWWSYWGNASRRSLFITSINALHHFRPLFGSSRVPFSFPGGKGDKVWGVWILRVVADPCSPPRSSPMGLMPSCIRVSVEIRPLIDKARPGRPGAADGSTAGLATRVTSAVTVVADAALALGRRSALAADPGRDPAALVSAPPAG